MSDVEVQPPAERGRRPPGPRGHWFLGSLPAMRRDQLGLFQSAWREHGDIVRIRFIPGVNAYLIAHPEAIEHILQKNHKNYRKPSFFIGVVRGFLGDGLFTSEGEHWLRHRRLMQPAFHRQHLSLLSRDMVAATQDLLSRWAGLAEGRVIDISSEMLRLSLRIAGLTMFGADLSQDADVIGPAFRSGFEFLRYRLDRLPLVPTWVPTKRHRRFWQDKRTLSGVVRGMIDERRRNPGQHHDLLSLLLAAQDEETGSALTDAEVVDEALTLLTAGHDTVGAALAWTWLLLGQHPDIQESLHDEVHRVLGGRSPTIDDLTSLPLVRAALDESMRLYPPAPGVAREAIADDVVMGFRIPKKVPLIVSSYVTHRRPDLWEEPERFKPERFLPEQSSNRPKFAYFPFGGGPRICIGNTFALTEGTLILAALLQAYRFELVPGQTIIMDQTFTLRPKNAVLVRMFRR